MHTSGHSPYKNQSSSTASTLPYGRYEFYMASFRQESLQVPKMRKRRKTWFYNVYHLKFNVYFITKAHRGMQFFKWIYKCLKINKASAKALYFTWRISELILKERFESTKCSEKLLLNIITSCMIVRIGYSSIRDSHIAKTLTKNSKHASGLRGW